SSGTVPAVVSSVALSGSGFEFGPAVLQPGPLLPGQTVVFSIRAVAREEHASAGGANGTLTVSAVDVQEQTLALSFLSGTAGCQPRALTPNVAIGSVVVGQGSAGVASIRNIGDAPCRLSSARSAVGLPFDT